MKKYFIDGGGHDGCSVRKFIKENHGFEIYSFECNPRFFPNYRKLPTTLIKKAIWIDNNIHKFFFQRGNVSGASGLIRKKNLVNYKIGEVVCIDLSKWILDKFYKTDYIILKLDIEGAEYDVLEKMIVDGSLEYINKLFIEWHNHKLIDKNDNRHNSLIEKIEKIGTPIEYWDAIDERIIR